MTIKSLIISAKLLVKTVEAFLTNTDSKKYNEKIIYNEDINYDKIFIFIGCILDL